MDYRLDNSKNYLRIIADFHRFRQLISALRLIPANIRLLLYEIPQLGPHLLL